MSQIFSNNTHAYDIEILWDLSVNLKTGAKKIVDLEYQLKEVTWDISPIDIINLFRNDKTKVDHWNRVVNADFAYPILICPDGWICDGMHRLVKAFIYSCPVITFKQFETWQEMEPAIISKGKL